MTHVLELSDHCIIDHFEADVPPVPTSALWMLRASLLRADRKMHFTGLRGAPWRLLRVDRSPQNPNICNI